MTRTLRSSTLKVSQKKIYRLDRTKNDADLHTNNSEGPDFGKHAKVYFDKDDG